MTCRACGKALPEATARRQFCDPRCRARYWREERDRVVREALDTAERAVQKVRRALGGREES